MLHTKFKVIGLLACDLDQLNKLSFPHPMEASYEMALTGPVVSEETMFENVDIYIHTYIHTDDTYKLITEPSA